MMLDERDALERGLAKIEQALSKLEGDLAVLRWLVWITIVLTLAIASLPGLCPH
jgi:hypothetical protein